MIVLILLTSILSAQNYFNSSPDWTSQAQGHVATGLGIADINQDGWDDIIVANGNDILRQNVVVYYNNGDGTFPAVPGWQSSDTDYHGHLSAGDINGDGYPDIAVSVFLGPGGFYEPGGVKVYFNHQGQLENIPSYRTADSMFTFSCALGDADGDGDLDLAVAGGQPYAYGIGPYYTPGRIYYNRNGVLDSLPGWLSANSMGALDVEFADMDRNGFLDLVFGCETTPNSVFLADSTGSMGTDPAWQSQDNNHYANSITIARVSNDLYPDLIVSDNNQLGGNGQFKAYYFSASPLGSDFPSWTSAPIDYASALLVSDLNGNGHPELLGGRWWGRLYIYPDSADSFKRRPGWFSGTSSVSEAFALKDLDRDGLFQATVDDTVSRDSVHVYDLNDYSFEYFARISVNGQALQSGIDYCTLPGKSWIAFRQPLVTGDFLTVEYYGSRKKDLVVTNWDQSIGNFLFYNRYIPASLTVTDQHPREFEMEVYPNPFNSSCRFILSLEKPLDLRLSIYDVLGRNIRTIVSERLSAGVHRFLWDGKDDTGQDMGSGMYFYGIEAGNESLSGKLLMVK